VSEPNLTTLSPPARTHAEAAALFRRPFAPGAIGFRAVTEAPYRGEPDAGAQVAAYLGAHRSSSASTPSSPAAGANSSIPSPPSSTRSARESCTWPAG
jgi:hypothetical protein